MIALDTLADGPEKGAEHYARTELAALVLAVTPAYDRQVRGCVAGLATDGWWHALDELAGVLTSRATSVRLMTRHVATGGDPAALASFTDAERALPAVAEVARHLRDAVDYSRRPADRGRSFGAAMDAVHHAQGIAWCDEDRSEHDPRLEEP